MEALMMGVVSLGAMGAVIFFALLTLMMTRQQQPVRVRAPASQEPLKEGLLGLVRFGWVPERLAGRMLRQAETGGYEKVWGMTAAGFIFIVLMSTQLTQQAAQAAA